jgi:DNA-binding response OmpR family regulator
MRVLIVEDDFQLARLTKGGLEQHGYAVDLVHDGDDGFELALTESYDLILLDVILPGLDGFTVSRQLRAASRDMPILLLTACDSIDDRVAGLDSGADDYLIKPYSFRELLARARALLRRNSQSKNPLITLGTLSLNTNTHEVRVRGRLVHLTNKEYALLEFMARNPNCVLTRGQIIEHVWNYEHIAESNIVDVYIRYLRRKLYDTTEPRLLHTIRGVGYQLKTVDLDVQ